MKKRGIKRSTISRCFFFFAALGLIEEPRAAFFLDRKGGDPFQVAPGRTLLERFTFFKPPALREVDDSYPGLLFWKSFNFSQTS